MSAARSISCVVTPLPLGAELRIAWEGYEATEAHATTVEAVGEAIRSFYYPQPSAKVTMFGPIAVGKRTMVAGQMRFAAVVETGITITARYVTLAAEAREVLERIALAL